ncbi:M24 family metallopeptidase [Candidatus Gottesmanbacteria bacterium]|nr:M24 family metallopeptidase [Candidatus Gottesmanbacteria bacterium]
MIHLKSDQEIATMKAGGQKLQKVLNYLLENARVGVSLLTLDKIAEDKITSLGAESSFKKVPNYHWTCCFSVNDVVVHGIPTEYKIKNGDIVGIDCGVYYAGFHTDSAWTILVNNQEATRHPGSGRMDSPGLPAGKAGVEESQKRKFLQVGEDTLQKALKQVKLGNRIGHISKTIQENIEKAGYSVVASLTGHGVGKNLHEDPQVPGILRKELENTPLLEKGMVLAVEVIYNLGSPDVVYKGDDGWTIATKDAKISGLFESTVALSADGVFVLT